MNILNFIKKQKLVFLFTLIYVCVIIFVSIHHEVWRDEVHPLNLVRESENVSSLLKNVKEEGHPSLWFLLLYVSFKIFQMPLILKVLSISIATIAIFVFLLK